MKVFWTTVLKQRQLRADEVLILLKACEAYDRAEQARRVLKREGLTYQDRFDQPRSRPEVAVERDSRAQFAKLVEKLNLWSSVLLEEPWSPDLSDFLVVNKRKRNAKETPEQPSVTTARFKKSED